MALSDVCFDFTQAIVAASKRLQEDADWYVDSVLNYGEELQALRKACLDVQTEPWNPESAVVLIRLATSVMKYHDTPPGNPDENKRRSEMDHLIILLKENLSEADATEVKTLLPDVVGDNPSTTKAAMRLKAILSKLGKGTYDVAIKVISDIASETAKKIFGFKP